MAERPSRLRTLGACALLLGAVWAGASVTRSALGSHAGNLPPSGVMVPAHRGHVADLVIQFHRDGAERFLPVYRELLGALATDTTVHAVVADAEDERVLRAAVDEWRSERPYPRVVFVQTGRPITSWARDRMAVLSDGGRAVLVAPPRPQVGPEGRAHDWLVPWALRRHLAEHAAIRAAPFVFDGGDLIADEWHVFVATPLFERNPETRSGMLEAQINELTGLETVRIGSRTEPVPDHHIGMFLTPLGDGRVAVGDPDMGLRALDRMGRERPDLPLSVGGAPLALDLEESRLERFRNVRRALEARGFGVVGIPILPAREKFVFLSYNNVLLDERPDGLHVVLPTYGVDALDAAATLAWERAGAIVHPVRVDGIFRLGGSVRCLVAPLRRVS